jgi:hypothetical protein
VRQSARGHDCTRLRARESAAEVLAAYEEFGTVAEAARAAGGTWEAASFLQLGPMRPGHNYCAFPRILLPGRFR